MALLKPKEFYSRVRSGECKPVYLFAGEEVYQQEEAWRFLEQKLGVDSLNLEIFYCGELSVSELMLAAQTHPFMAERRLLLVKDAHRLKSADMEALSKFLKNPLDTVCIVFFWPERVRRENKSGAFFKVIESSGDVVEFRALYDNEVPAWVRERFKAAHRNISEDAVISLIAESGTNLLDLNNEIEKLLLYCAGKKEITVEDVERVSGHTRQSNLNSLADTIESGRTAAALKIAENLLGEGEIPLKILATIYRVIRRMLIASSLMQDSGMTKEQVKKELNLNAYFDRNFFYNLSKYDSERLLKCMKIVLRADTELKSSSMPEEMVFEELILSL